MYTTVTGDYRRSWASDPAILEWFGQITQQNYLVETYPLPGKPVGFYSIPSKKEIDCFVPVIRHDERIRAVRFTNRLEGDGWVLCKGIVNLLKEDSNLRLVSKDI